MEAVVILEHRFKQNSAGEVFATSSSVNTLLWDRYLEVFDILTIVARVEFSDNVRLDYKVSYQNVSFIKLPYYVGGLGFLKNYLKIRKTLLPLIKNRTAYIFRLPSINSNILISELLSRRIPYIVELVGDPWDAYSAASLGRSPALQFHRYRSYFAVRKNVFNATGVIYVTQQVLQTRYPANKTAITCGASNVILRKQDIVSEPRVYIDSHKDRRWRLLSIGSLDQMYKSPDICVKAVKLLIEQGIKLEFHWLGGGANLCSMVKMVSEYELKDQFFFHGNVPREEVLQHIDCCDIYIHIAKTEGLPRSLIEAMARGVACIGSNVGGIPELLDKDSIINIISASSLANKVHEYLSSTTYLNDKAKGNLSKARDFEYTRLQAKRKEVYLKLRNLINTNEARSHRSS